LRCPDGAERLILASFPTLKRWANDRCAYGAIEIGTRLVNNTRLANKMDSCDRLVNHHNPCGGYQHYPVVMHGATRARRWLFYLK